MRVLVQAGHSAAFPPFMLGGGGAPGEAEWATSLTQRLAARLSLAGVEVVCVGCWSPSKPSTAPPEVTHHDYDLFVSNHFDAAIYAQNTGCFADRAALDPLGAQSDAAVRAWETVYPAATGIPLHNERRNPNTWDYYGFRATTAKTPGILIEHGVGQGLDHAVLFDHIETVAAADASAILATLGISPTPEVPDVSVLDDAQAIAAAQALWNARGIPFNPDTALAKAWLAEWRAGRFRGLPDTNELPVEPGEIAVQGFDGGAATWKNGEPVSWEA